MLPLIDLPTGPLLADAEIDRIICETLAMDAYGMTLAEARAWLDFRDSGRLAS